MAEKEDGKSVLEKNAILNFIPLFMIFFSPHPTSGNTPQVGQSYLFEEGGKPSHVTSKSLLQELCHKTKTTYISCKWLINK
jgi:hypothetical protein